MTFLASAYSFGVLLAFTAAQAAVIRLRVLEPDLPRPFRARPEVRWRGALLPLPALIGAPLAFAVWILAMVTHPGARYAGPAWLAGGVVVYLVVRWYEEHGVFEEVEPITSLPPGAEFTRVLVPMKLGDIGEEMVATAVALAKERHADRSRRSSSSGCRASSRSRGRCRATSPSAPDCPWKRHGRWVRTTASMWRPTRSRLGRSDTRSSTRRRDELWI